MYCIAQRAAARILLPKGLGCAFEMPLKCGLPYPGFLKDSAGSLRARNLFGRDPRIVLQAAGFAYDANNANIYGRVVSLNLTRKF
jgi:hypothetical protein